MWDQMKKVTDVCLLCFFLVPSKSDGGLWKVKMLTLGHAVIYNSQYLRWWNACFFFFALFFPFNSGAGRPRDTEVRRPRFYLVSPFGLLADSMLNGDNHHTIGSTPKRDNHLFGCLPRRVVRIGHQMIWDDTCKRILVSQIEEAAVRINGNYLSKLLLFLTAVFLCIANASEEEVGGKFAFGFCCFAEAVGGDYLVAVELFINGSWRALLFERWSYSNDVWHAWVVVWFGKLKWMIGLGVTNWSRICCFRMRFMKFLDPIGSRGSALKSLRARVPRSVEHLSYKQMSNYLK